MNIKLKERFLHLWNKYFVNAELPIVFFYTEGTGGAEWAEIPKGRSCIICELAKVRAGKSLVYNEERIWCMGAKRYMGYLDKMRPGFEYFLSCGNDEMEGERYIRTPDMVKQIMKNQKKLPVDGKKALRLFGLEFLRYGLSKLLHIKFLGGGLRVDG